MNRVEKLSKTLIDPIKFYNFRFESVPDIDPKAFIGKYNRFTYNTDLNVLYYDQRVVPNIKKFVYVIKYHDINFIKAIFKAMSIDIDTNNISEYTLYNTYYYLVSNRVPIVKKRNIILYDIPDEYLSDTNEVRIYNNGEANYVLISTNINISDVEVKSITISEISYLTLTKYCNDDFIINYQYEPYTLFHYAENLNRVNYLILGITNIKSLYVKLDIINTDDRLSDLEYWVRNYLSYFQVIDYRVSYNTNGDFLRENLKETNLMLNLDMLTDGELNTLFNFILVHAPQYLYNRSEIIKYIRRIVYTFDLDKISWRFGKCKKERRDYELIKGTLLEYRCYSLKEITLGLKSLSDHDRLELYTLLRTFGKLDLYDKDNNYIFPINVTQTAYDRYKNLYNSIDNMISA